MSLLSLVDAGSKSQDLIALADTALGLLMVLRRVLLASRRLQWPASALWYSCRSRRVACRALMMCVYSPCWSSRCLHAIRMRAKNSLFRGVGWWRADVLDFAGFFGAFEIHQEVHLLHQLLPDALLEH